MKSKANYFVVIFAVILFLFGTGIYGYLSGGERQEPYHVSIVMDSNNSEHWSVFKQGAESGAKECNTEVNFVNISSQSSVSEYLSIIRREIQNGAEGLILSLDNNSRMVKELEGILMDTQVVMIESTIPLLKEYSCISPDNYKMGEDLGEIILSKRQEGKRVGIVAGSKRRTSNMERKNGLFSALGEKNVQWVLEVDTEVTAEQIKKQCKAQPVDYIVGVNNVVTEIIVDVFKENDEEVKIFGIGNTEKIVYYMDKGLMDTIVTPNEYVMGYSSIKTMYNRLNYGTADEAENIDYLVVDQKNLYDIENQKFMFPMVQ